MYEDIREARENESGFTLIELLIVIVILGVLAAIVVFAVGGINDTARRRPASPTPRTSRSRPRRSTRRPARTLRNAIRASIGTRS